MKRPKKFDEALDAYNEEREDVARALMEECAREGDPVACYLAALWRHDGVGGPIDTDESDRWMARLEQFAKAGDLEAQWELSLKFRFGDLLPLDIDAANHWLERAANAGDGEAQHHLAWYFETGQYDYPVDPSAAAAWYKRAYDGGHPETIYLYAIRLFRDGRPTDEAIALLRRAADKGFEQAQRILDSFRH